MLTDYQRLFGFCIARALCSSSQAGRGDRQGGKKCRLGPGDFGRLPGSFKTPATRQGGESSSAQELWRTSRRASSTVIDAHRFAGCRVEASRERDRRYGRIAHPSGTSERRFFPSPQVRSLFCICWSRKKLGGLGHRRCQAIGEDRPLRGQGKGVESEELVAKEFDKLSDHPLAPFSDRATKQRDRCRFPQGEAAQGPLPIDYSMEIEADFPTDLVVVMQESAAKKARRTVIGRMLVTRSQVTG